MDHGIPVPDSAASTSGTSVAGGIRARLRPRTLSGKGRAALALVVLYFLVSGICIGVERLRLFDAMRLLEEAHEHDRVLLRAEVAVAQAALEVTGASYGARELALPPAVADSLESARGALDRLSAVHPPAGQWSHAIGSRTATLRAADSRGSWVLMREVLRDVRAELQAHRALVAQRLDVQRARFTRTYDLITVTWILIGLFGIAGVGTVIGTFFGRLTRDLALLERRAAQIVEGQRGGSVVLQRDDEVRSLAEAVNRMSADLAERERRLELEQHHRAYHEKMAALGALTAGVAHEVNNPLTTICAIGEELAEDGARRGDREIAERGSAILAEARRAATATGRLASLAALQPADFEWIDFDDLVRRTASLLGYDRRYARIRFELALAGDLPAVHTVPARLQQGLFELIGTGAEALRESGGTLRLRTRTAGDTVELALADSRATDAAETVARALGAGTATEAAPAEAQPYLRARAVLAAIDGAVSGGATPTGFEVRLAVPTNPASAGLRNN